MNYLRPRQASGQPGLQTPVVWELGYCHGVNVSLHAYLASRTRVLGRSLAECSVSPFTSLQTLGHSPKTVKTQSCAIALSILCHQMLHGNSCSGSHRRKVRVESKLSLSGLEPLLPTLCYATRLFICRMRSWDGVLFKKDYFQPYFKSYDLMP